MSQCDTVDYRVLLINHNLGLESGSGLLNVDQMLRDDSAKKLKHWQESGVDHSFSLSIYHFLGKTCGKPLLTGYVRAASCNRPCNPAMKSSVLTRHPHMSQHLSAEDSAMFQHRNIHSFD